MNNALIARDVLEAVGGSDNIISNSVCMTRLRLTLLDPSKVDADAINALHSVLGLTRRGQSGIEVVFGPSSVDAVAREFSRLSGHGMGMSGHKDALGGRESSADPLRVEISPGQRRSYEAQVASTSVEATPDDSDVDALRHLFEDDPDGQADVDDREAEEETIAPSHEVTDTTPPDRRILVINGPNINMLGIREPAIYGNADYATLVALCHTAGQATGFSEVTCFQSNHEGDLIDEIQAAWKVYDGIVINPGALTHTSIALLDALKAVDIPCVEVHISKVDEREDFRQVSYVRAACFETIMGLGLEGYAKAIGDLAAHLADGSRTEHSS
ncbi:MAG: type II 3-dehydroquinate dehydratase [Atopobiaceae bacterium]|jgi:3-dehydroquinate dehydratase-2|nr:type II 3-dehydroquinate dehydratase [Atopobiaceae bacterium]MCH4180087.1 type II 3-dehydroquinate dehydratase [Atopobiaceae bacterium]MCH4213861.1 type II 3-dehydroquinate dehydratase [Atopobiaceae bacterium]MCH4229963.1 type II 3-dehydroquinate dehydratase [Atopobiaceae bacterium]MCH4275676.1 type II 3-dehydroquinate dehydratase [Atopobiaceae bacterium]